MPNADTLPPGRDLDDVEAMRDAYHASILDSLKAKFPIEGKTHVLSLENPQFHNYRNFSTKEQKRAIMRNETLYNRLHGTLLLKDKATGEVIDKKRGTLMNVPWVTQRGTFIHSGNEYTLASQLRLRSGVFSRRRDNGELEAHFNVASGTGPQFRVWMEPETGIFRIRMQQANLKLYPVLQALGYDDESLKQAWGPQILEANRNTPPQEALRKFYDRLAGYKADPMASDAVRLKSIKDMLARMELDPDVTERTLGRRYSNVEPASILDATHKLLRLNRGEDDTDDRDALQYQTLHSLEDFAADRIRKDASHVARNLLWKASYKKSLKSIGTAPFSPWLEGLIIGNPLAMPLEEINPLALLEQQYRVSRMGPGGISSQSAIPDEARAVHPSQAGYMDLVASPESSNIGVDTRMAYGTRKGLNGKMFSRMINNKTGREEWVEPAQLTGKSLAFNPLGA